MTSKRTRRVMLYLALGLLSLAAVTSSWTPEVGRDELLWSPFTLGLPLVMGWAGAEALTHIFRLEFARFTATLGLGLATVVLVIRLAFGYFTPAAARDPDIWHLWPLFTGLWMFAICALCYGAAFLAGLSSALVRWAGRE